ncbi:MAG: PEP-CTERM sorting domain-containing protein [Gammaproteobacteria bacterium]|nr:PEP-CTERM sorting domain-containing protein [Gammaproteobacteria bacterium]
MTHQTLTAVALCAVCAGAQAGPFAPAAGQSGSTAIAKTSSLIAAWASGYENYQPGSNVDAAFRTPDKALGPAVGNAFDVVALGDAGRITLTFSGSIYNGPGWDFAVFENSFSDTFLKFAFVEVSSNGRSYFRFPSFSFTPSPVSAFGSIDPTNVDGLAGKYRQGFGTPFDLDLFKNVPGIDINHITEVRLADVVGNGTEKDNWPTSLGGPHFIYDPFHTTGSGGFDLEALGVRYLNAVAAAPVPLPTPAMLLLAPLVALTVRTRARV